MKNVVYDEYELSIAINNIEKHADYLSRSIDEYISILKKLKSDGIKDKEICSRIEELISSLTPYRYVINDDCRYIKSNINKSMNEVSSADNFKYPTTITDAVASILSRFL